MYFNIFIFVEMLLFIYHCLQAITCFRKRCFWIFIKENIWMIDNFENIKQCLWLLVFFCEVLMWCLFLDVWVLGFEHEKVLVQFWRSDWCEEFWLCRMITGSYDPWFARDLACAIIRITIVKLRYRVLNWHRQFCRIQRDWRINGIDLKNVVPLFLTIEIFHIWCKN